MVASVVAGDKTAWLRLIKWTIVRLANHIRSFTLTGQPLAYKVDDCKPLPSTYTTTAASFTGPTSHAHPYTTPLAVAVQVEFESKI